MEKMVVGTQTMKQKERKRYAISWMMASVVLLSAGPALMAQRAVRADTLNTPGVCKRMYLTLDVPEGEIFLESSGQCGSSFVQFSSPHGSTMHHVAESWSQSGIMNRRFFLGHAQAKGPSPLVAENTMLPPIMGAGFQSYSIGYRQDPSVQTHLTVRLEKGGLLLEPSLLHLEHLDIHSSFANVNLQYDAPNQSAMEDLTVHVARATLVVKNLEFARARLVQLQNDMGDTRIWLGNGLHPGSQVRLRAGAGNVMLYVDEHHPVEIQVRTSLFSGAEIHDSFQEVAPGIFRNHAYQMGHARPNFKPTVITCQLDMGKLFVVEAARD
jgi:hypothetical protein